jgi:hypothetical protein
VPRRAAGERLGINEVNTAGHGFYRLQLNPRRDYTPKS